MAKLFKKVLTFICGAVLVCGAFSLPLMTNQNVDVVGKAEAAVGDELAVLQGFGSGYSTRKTTTDSYGVGWTARTGQNGYLGVNNSSNHNNVKVEENDLSVVQGALPEAKTGDTGIYYYYTTTAVANVGSIVFSYTAATNYTAAEAKLYVVSGTTLSEFSLVTLSSDSEATQGNSVGSNLGATYTFKFDQTQTDLKYYGLVIKLNAYQRYTAGKIQLIEGETTIATEITSLSLGGNMSKTTYVNGESWDPTGLTVLGNPGVDDIDITDRVVWSYNPTIATLGVTSVEVTATYENLSQTTIVEGINVLNVIVDEINKDKIEFVEGSSYRDYVSFTDNSGATYDGHGYPNNYIQLRDTSPSGIISSTSGGHIRKVEVLWNSSSNSSRSLDVFVTNEKIAGPSLLYSMTSNGNIAFSSGNSVVYEVVGDYKYVGLKANGGSINIDSIKLYWEPIDYTPEAETFASLIIDDINCINNTADRGEGYVEGLSQEWLVVADFWNDLSEEAKALFVDSTDNETIKAALAKYDYILSHYGSDDASFPNFMNREVISAANNIINPTLDTTNNIIIIVAVSVLALTAIGVFVVMYRKRRLSK